MKNRLGVFVVLFFGLLGTSSHPRWLLIALVAIVGVSVTGCLVACARRP